MNYNFELFCKKINNIILSFIFHIYNIFIINKNINKFNLKFILIMKKIIELFFIIKIEDK